jgi:uncharacterized protein with ParB-like and HNH nuclease domain
MSVISVISSNEDSAAEVFETLNDRGVGLSTPDLLRNLVIRRAAERERAQIVQMWAEVLQFENDADIKSFIRHYWISHHGDVKTQRLYREIKTELLNRNVSSATFSRQLRDAAGVYRQIVDGRDSDAEVEAFLVELGELGANILYPAALAIMESVPDANKALLLNLVINAYVRQFGHWAARE